MRDNVGGDRIQARKLDDIFTRFCKWLYQDYWLNQNLRTIRIMDTGAVYQYCLVGFIGQLLDSISLSSVSKPPASGAHIKDNTLGNKL